MATQPDGAYYADTNGVPKADGRVTHLGLAAGELAPRIVTVGSLSRAKRLRAALDAPNDAFELTSDRGFTTFTGTFGGERVSIVATGMGSPMMDFLVREARNIVDGPMLFIRYGSCGGLSADALPGTVVVNTPGSVWLAREYDAFDAPGDSSTAYKVSRAVTPDAALAGRVCDTLRAAIGSRTLEGLNASADSFYGSQGRRDEHFDDRNGDVVERLIAEHPDVASMEMESFQLLHLARSSKPAGSVRAASAAIVCANRASAEVITTDALHEVEEKGGRAVLEAVTTCALVSDVNGSGEATAAKRAKTK